MSFAWVKLLVLGLALPAAVEAQFSYITQNGAITITGYTGSGGVVTIPNTISSLPVTSIGNNAFNSITSLASVIIGTNVATIGDRAFFSCTSLTNVALPNSITNIGNNAFNHCLKLANAMLPNSVTSIGSNAFWDCSSLTNVVIPASLASIGSQVFSFCYNLQAITVDASNPSYGSVAGVLYDKNQTALIQCPGGKGGSLTIPSSVNSVGASAFGDCNKLTGVYFKNNAPAADSTAFNGASKVVVYYLAGTSGWSTTLGGAPTLLWNPQAQTSDSSFGLRTNQFGFNVIGTTNIPIVVEASTNLINWQPVNTNTLTTGMAYFSDSQWTNYPARFYRIRSP
jgi:hypothetical protein